jgi:hypothetical protein
MRWRNGNAAAQFTRTRTEQYVDGTRRKIDEKKKRRIIDIVMLLVHVIIDIKVF